MIDYRFKIDKFRYFRNVNHGLRQLHRSKGNNVPNQTRSKNRLNYRLVIDLKSLNFDTFETFSSIHFDT